MVNCTSKIFDLSARSGGTLPSQFTMTAGAVPTLRSVTMKEIQLTQGQVALVDDEDCEWLNQWKWHAHWSCHTHSYYANRTLRLANGKGIKIWMHRQIIGLERGEKRQCDHINHETLDNQRANLRIVSPSENQWNRRNPKGYHWNKLLHKYVAQIGVNWGKKYLGLFTTAEEANTAYKKAKQQYHII